MKTSRAAVVSLALLLSLGACAPAGRKGPTPAPQLHRAETTVRITNNNWATVVVYVVRSGTPARIGMVTSMRTEVLRIPRSLMPTTGSVSLMVDPIGSRYTYISPAVQVGPGQQIEFNIENHLAISSISVWE